MIRTRLESSTSKAGPLSNQAMLCDGIRFVTACVVSSSMRKIEPGA